MKAGKAFLINANASVFSNYGELDNFNAKVSSSWKLCLYQLLTFLLIAMLIF